MEAKDIIIENKPVSQNFIPIPIEEDHAVLGDQVVPREVLIESGHGWGAYLPLGETQFKNGVDPSSCPAGGLLNMVEAVGKLKYGKSFQNDLSERYLSIMSGMDGHGGNPHLVAEVMRTGCGAIPEAFLPFNDPIDTLAKYFSPNPMKYSLFIIGLHWLKKYEFGHDWVFNGGPISEKQRLIKESLKYSPVGVAGYAWSLHADGKYYNDGPAIHWFEVYDYVEGDHWLAFDTYFDGTGSCVKKLDWNYNFAYAKRCYLNRRLGSENMGDNPQHARIDYCRYILKWLLQDIIKPI